MLFSWLFFLTSSAQFVLYSSSDLFLSRCLPPMMSIKLLSIRDTRVSLPNGVHVKRG